VYKKVKPQKSDGEMYFCTPERIKQKIRGAFPIDDKIGWYPFAYNKALELLRSKQYDAIVATVGPFTSGIIAYQLHKKTKIPYFVDYRDHWTLNAYPRYSLRLLHKHAQICESMMLESARGVFVTSKLKKENMLAKFGEHLREKTECVYNGFDEDDFSDCLPKKDTTQRHIRYVGTFCGYRSVEYFVQAIKEIKDEIPSTVTIEFIGNYHIETLSLLKSSEVINVHSQVTHSKAVNLMRTADLLLLFVSSVDGEDFMPGKVFEYIRANVPVLAMVPMNGEPAKILQELGHTAMCKMEDVDAIKAHLRDFFTQDRKPMVKSETSYSRENQTKIFAEFIEKRLALSQNPQPTPST
jgi:glycosyltransferase involved in cell wall biosynthesis